MRLLLFLHLLPVAFPLLSPLSPMPRGARASTPRLASSPLDSPPPPASPPPGASDLAVAPPPELSRLFSTLAPAEQYSTTLLGICGKIVDGPAAQGGAARGGAAATSPGADSLGDCWLLLEEMCGLAHCASPRAASALLTATAASAAPQAVARSVSLLLRSVSPSGLSSSYGCYAAPVRVPRIRDPPPLPADDRAKEVTAAVSFLGALGTSLTLSSAMSASGADPLLPNAATVSLLSALFADNFYNIFSKLSTLFPKLPDLPPLPPSFPLGSGDLTRVLVAGLSRLATSDPSRDCRVEAAALVGAYKLGLPTFPFQASSLEAAACIVDSTEEGSPIGRLDALPGIVKALVWLFVPVAYEEMKYPQLVSSDPREPLKLYERLEKAGVSSMITKDEQLRSDALQHAYGVAKKLAREFGDEIEAVAEQLLGGGVTVGDVVVGMEGWDGGGE